LAKRKNAATWHRGIHVFSAGIGQLVTPAKDAAKNTAGVGAPVIPPVSSVAIAGVLAKTLVITLDKSVTKSL
jgi:hypothetical protein